MMCVGLFLMAFSASAIIYGFLIRALWIPVSVLVLIYLFGVALILIGLTINIWSFLI